MIQGENVYNETMNEIKATLGKGGRINIPADHRRALGMSEGDEVLVGLMDGAVTIQTRESAIERAQRMVVRYAGEGVSLVDELSAERREAAGRGE